MQSLLQEIKMDISAYKKRPGLASFLYMSLFEPGFAVTTLYRVYHRLYCTKSRMGKAFGKVLWRFNTLISGCYFHPKARISGGLYLPHPTGVVIGDGVVVGQWSQIYQSVTLGADSNARYPVIEDKVLIFPGSCVIGDVRIGTGSIVGANSFVNRDVAPYVVVAGIPAKQIRSIVVEASDAQSPIPNNPASRPSPEE